jgi:isoleucyl-tRNA synthetase
MGAFSKALSALDPQIYAISLENGETVNLDLGDEMFEADKSHVLINISAKEGFTVKMENNRFIILDTHLTDELISEGYAREMISRVQQMRKANDFEMMANIRIYYTCDEVFGAAVEAHKDYIMSETLAVSVEASDASDAEAFNLNGHDVKLFVEQV